MDAGRHQEAARGGSKWSPHAAVAAVSTAGAAAITTRLVWWPGAGPPFRSPDSSARAPRSRRSADRPLPRAPRPRELAEADRGRARALVVAGGVVQQALDAPEPQPVGGVAEQPPRDAAPAQRLVDVQLPEIGPAGEARQHAAGGEVGLHLDHADGAAVEQRGEARRVRAERAAHGEARERRRAPPPAGRRGRGPKPPDAGAPRATRPPPGPPPPGAHGPHA